MQITSLLLDFTANGATLLCHSHTLVRIRIVAFRLSGDTEKPEKPLNKMFVLCVSSTYVVPESCILQQ